MIMGVFLHAANIYAPNVNWILADSATHPVFGWFIALIHAFRMQAFYWISGYFTALVFTRKTGTAALGKRLQRISIPLLFTWLVINFAQDLVTTGKSYGHWHLAPVYHLWFLFDLLIYTVIGFLICRSSRLVAILAHPARQDLAIGRAAVGFVFCAWLLSVLARTTPVAYVEWFGLTSLDRLSTFLPWFLLGGAMYFQKKLTDRFTSIPGWYLPLAAAGVVFIDPFTSTGPMLTREVALLIQIALIFCCVGGPFVIPCGT